jgi:hypothetical protein
MKPEIKKIESTWCGRSLKNYLNMHKQTAEDRGCLGRFLASKTLTEARKVLRGLIKK